MQATYDAIAGDRVLLLVALASGVLFAIVGSYLAGKLADMVGNYGDYVDRRVGFGDRHGRATNYDSDVRLARRLFGIAHALDRIRGPLPGAGVWRRFADAHNEALQHGFVYFVLWPLSAGAVALYWRAYTWRAHRRVRQRIDSYTR